MKADEGIYRAKAVEWDLGYTATGKEQIAIRFRLLDVDEDNPYITWYGYFTDKTTERTLDSLRLCGWSSDNLFELDDLDANEVDLVLAYEVDQKGEQRLRVRWVNSRGGLALKDRMSEGDKKAFAERMRGAVLAHKHKTRPTTKPTGAHPHTASNAIGDDGIPF